MEEKCMLTKRDLLKSSVAVAAVAAVAGRTDRAGAQEIAQLQIFVPAAPGGGWDQTARTIEQVLKAEKLIGTAQITNVGGAGGAVGLPQFINQWHNRPNAVMVAGMVMVGALIANKSPVKLTQTLPVARLTGEAEVLVVPANSAIKSAKEFAAALKADPKKMSCAGGSAGGTDHILLGMVGKALGVPAAQLSYVAYPGGGPALAAVLGGHVAIAISGWGEFSEQIKAGKIRPLAISAPERIEGIDVPTLKQEGIDVELMNWRGVFAPPGVKAQQRQAMITLIEKMAASASWKEELKKRDWTPILLTGDEYGKFIEAETARIEAILKDLGLA
jgi:putative tricarboxylic transport membrane protein